MMAPAGAHHSSAGPKRVKLNILSQWSNVSFHQLRTSCRISAGPSRASSRLMHCSKGVLFDDLVGCWNSDAPWHLRRSGGAVHGIKGGGSEPMVSLNVYSNATSETILVNLW
jgi:hypothetical protein